MPAVPLKPDYSNVGKFVDSLFSPDVRTLDAINPALRSGATTATFTSQLPMITAVWLAAWQASQGDPYNAQDLKNCPTSDHALMQFLATYFRANPLTMFLPKIQLEGFLPKGEMPIYQLSGYTGQALFDGGEWDYPNVEQFLELLLVGAHFVVIHAAKDLPPGDWVAPFYELFTGSSQLKPYRRHDPGNSHYTSTTNVCGYYVPDVRHDKAPTPCPFALAFLACPTVSAVGCSPKVYNTFLQLEGWEATHSRHNADYKTIYQPTLWNVSTYGACAYSEKRATAIFLAPADWNPQISPQTFMPPYVGAETPQKWLNKKTVVLPPGVGSSS